MRNLLYTLSLLCLIAFSSKGQDAKFYATVTKATVGLNENFQLSFVLENGDGKNIKLPPLGDYNVLGGPSQSSGFSFVNGVTSRSLTISYLLQPRAVGKFTIGSASIDVNGKTYVSNKIPIEVVKGNAPAQQPNAGANGGGGNQAQNNLQQQLKDNLFAKASVDKTEVYQGEQITATYKLYTRTQIGNTNLTKEPTYNGFWKQELDMPQSLAFQPEIVGGVKYNGALIKKLALFPERAGDLELEPMGLKSVVRVQKQSRNIFDDFFGSYQDVPFEFETNKIKIKVKPLPANKPADFSGFVGDLSMEVVLDKKETKTDDPITISVRFNGKGNLKVVETPHIDLPNDFDIFDPKMGEKVNKNNGIITGSRNFDFLAIPRRPGTFKLPPISISYFDPNSGKYKTLTSPEYTITVTGAPSKNAGTTVVNGMNKEEVQLLGQDIRYIKPTTGGLVKKTSPFFGSVAFASLYASPFALFLLLLLYRRREEQLASDIVGVRRKGATKIAIKRLKTAKQLMDNKNEKGFYDELSKAMWGYLGDKLNIDPSALNHESAMAALTEKNVSSETIANIFRVIADCEIALYAPAALVGTMGTLYEEARGLIDRLEDELSK